GMPSGSRGITSSRRSDLSLLRTTSRPRCRKMNPRSYQTRSTYLKNLCSILRVSSSVHLELMNTDFTSTAGFSRLTAWNRTKMSAGLSFGVDGTE
ncbi:hypothetical protein EGW08_005623, partial [Elysia chlorotica]